MRRFLTGQLLLVGPLLLAGLAAVGVSGLAGCTEPLTQINEVQPHYLTKTAFVGDWYFKQTVTRIAPHVATGFEGWEAGVEKIEWDVGENWLTGYRIHEAVPGLDQARTQDGGRYRGDPVIKFPITGHFDITRDYSATTGERGNRIQENTTDRPWYERAHFRVNWLGSVTDSAAELPLIRFSASAKDYIREHEIYDPDHLRIEDDFMQVTLMGEFSSSLATCVWTHGTWDCGTGEGRLRYAFVKIDEQRAAQFQPVEYTDLHHIKNEDETPFRVTSFVVPRGPDGYLVPNVESARIELHCTPELLTKIDDVLAPGVYEYIDDCREAVYEQMEKFGYFRTERYRYDRRLGAGHDDTREFYANVHDIWQNGRTQAADGTWAATPASELRPKPIVYYLNPYFPADLEPVAGQMANDWDAPFAVAAASKMDLGTDAAAVTKLRAQLTAASDGADWMYLAGDANQQGGMFQIRRNTCSTQGIEAYLADKGGKYDDVIEEATAGQGVLLGNIERVCSGLTHFTRARGEATPFTWQQVGDLRFNLVNWVVNPQPSGPLGYGPSAADPENGMLLAGSAHVYGASVDTYARSAADVIRALNEDLEINTLISGQSYIDWVESSRSVADMEFGLKADSMDRFDAHAGIDLDAAYGKFILPNGRVDGAAAEAHFERRLHNPVRNDRIHDVVNGPLDEGRQRLERLRQDPAFRSRMIDPQYVALLRPLLGLEPNDAMTPELEEAALDLGLSPEKFHAERDAYQAVLRENNVYMADFADDSIIGLAMEMKGLDPDVVYQRLREAIFRGVMLHEIGHTVGLRHNFEGSFDALNYHDEYWAIRERAEDADEHSRLRLSEYQYASIMDYGARFNSDIHGLGKYDLAAIKFAYGGLVETFHPDIEVPAALDTEVWIEGAELIPELLGGSANISRRVDVKASARQLARVEGAKENARLFMEDPTRPVVEYWRDTEVPYGFCSDEFNGNFSCRTWDEGASHTDVIRSAIRNYWNYYAFNSYRRGRSEQNFIQGFLGRQSRLASYITYPFRFFYYYQDYNIGIRNDMYEASLVGLNFINQVLGTPLPGKHCLDADRNLYVPASYMDPAEAANCEVLDLPFGTGRQETNTITDEYDYRLDYIGSYYDKASFVTFLMDTSSSFIRVTNIGDRRTFNIGYWRIFRKELLKLVRDMMFAWTDDDLNETVSGLVAPDGPAASRVVPRVLVARDEFNQSEADMVGMARLYAPVSYNMVWRTLVLSTVFNSSELDEQLDFAEYIAISETGSGDDRDYPEGWDVATFVHPLTGVEFRAGQTLDGGSLSHELITRANTFLDGDYALAKAATERSPFDGALRSNFEQANLRLQQYVDLMSDLRLLRSAVDLAGD